VGGVFPYRIGQAVFFNDEVGYTTKHDVSIIGGLRFSTSYIPLHVPEVKELTDKMKAQIEEGTRLATERIQQAIGQP